MEKQRNTTKAINLHRASRHPALRRPISLLESSLEKMLYLNTINEVYEKAIDDTSDNFMQNCLDALNIDCSVSQEDFKKIPTKGPLVIVSNHPFGGLEGVILGAMIAGVRKDVKLLGNYLLQHYEELRQWVIPVDPFGNPESIKVNSKGLKEAIQWVKNGGALITFPAGEVSHMQWKQGRVTDSAWSPHVGAIIRHAKGNVLPVYFPGKNGFLFQIMGMLHPKLRTALLPREFVNKQSRNIKLYIGKPIPWKKLESFESDRSTINYLRINTYFLRNRAYRKKLRLPSVISLKTKEHAQEEVIPPVPKPVLRREVESLPEKNRLVDTKDFTVFVAESKLIPELLREIGRLREITFREVREGTGKSVDLDQFDPYYLHLFLWNKTEEELVGAYRLGLMDIILKQFGPSGLYTSTLFRFKPGFLQQLGNAIELGRSFVRSKYQKEYSCLSLLWRGIGQFIIRNPRYNILVGPVSISHDYHAVSKKLIVQFLRQYKSDSGLSRYVRPRTPYHPGPRKMFGRHLLHSFVRDIDDISVLISEIEKDGRGIPILLRHYLKLNATILNFNVDKHFSNVVDGLIFVDLTKTDTKLLRRFMGQKGLNVFARHHELRPETDIERLPELI